MPASTVQENDHVIHHLDSVDPANGVMQGFPPPKGKRVTIDNYRSQFKDQRQAGRAKTRWAHLHMRELFPTQLIRRGIGPVRILSVQPVDLDKIRIPDGNGNTVTISEWLKRTDTDAFLVLHDGAIVREEYFHGMRQDTPHHLWSASKTISAGVVANLLAQGKLREQGPITDYVPELQGTGYEGATVRHLLDMRSGVAWDYESAGEKNTWPRWERTAGLARKLPGEPSNEGVYDFMLRAEDMKRRSRPHGSCFYYKESDPQALGWACEKVTETRFSDLLSQLIWSRLGAEQDAYILCDRAGTALPWGGISATLRDLGRWGQSYLDPFSHQEVVPRTFIDDTIRNYDPSAITEDSFMGPRQGQARNAAYRSLHWIYRYPGEDLIAAIGHYGQLCMIFPKRKLVFVKLSTYSGFSTIRELLELGQKDCSAFCAIADTLAGKVA
ncbi:MAG: serine hydrolase [Pirellulales bacterium]|nr:serine hydrolase [Pirellulales bacterium]